MVSLKLLVSLKSYHLAHRAYKIHWSYLQSLGITKKLLNFFSLETVLSVTGLGWEFLGFL